VPGFAQAAAGFDGADAGDLCPGGDADVGEPRGALGAEVAEGLDFGNELRWKARHGVELREFPQSRNGLVAPDKLS
jgi:hypothetical protein